MMLNEIRHIETKVVCNIFVQYDHIDSFLANHDDFIDVLHHRNRFNIFGAFDNDKIYKIV